MGVHGWRLVSLIGAAILGGYVFANAASIFLGGVLPLPPSEAAMTGHLLAFVFYGGAIIWVFHRRKPGRAWLYLLVSSTVLTTAGMAMGGSLP